MPFPGLGVAGGTVGKAVVELVGDTSKLQKDFNKAKSEVTSGSSEMASGFDKWKGAAIAGAAVAGAAIIAFAADAVRAFEEAEKVNAQTNATLESTGRAAGVGAGHIMDLAASLQDLSGVQDEEIQRGENLLLTFTNIRNEVGKGNDIFDQATKTMLDMSVALGQDTKSSAIQLGKALNDPIKGVTALQRVGVSFTAQQKEQIVTLVESGKAMEAQKLILGELQKEFGGSAEAVGKTFAGQVAILNANFDDLKESIGGVVVEGLTPLVSNLNKLIELAQKAPDPLKNIISDTFVNGVKNIVPGLGILTDMLGDTEEESSGAAASQRDLRLAMEAGTDETVRAAGAAQKLNDELKEQLANQQALAGGALGLISSARSFAESQRDVADAEGKVAKLRERGKEGTEKFTEATRALKDAQLDSVQSVAQLDSAASKYKQELEDAGLSQADVNEKLREYARRAGLSRSETDGLVDRITDLNREWGKLPDRPKELRVDARVSDAQRDFEKLIATINSVPGSVVLPVGVKTYVTDQGSGLASGGVIRAAAGVVTRPTILVGEGTRSTFAGKGAEAVIPFDDRGIAILAKALEMAVAKSGGRNARPTMPQDIYIGGKRAETYLDRKRTLIDG